MKGKEIFELAVRLLGLVFLYHGLAEFPGIIAAVTSFSIIGIIITIWPLFVAFWLIQGASWLVNIAYPDADD
jgi:hypothetical protein